MKDAEIGKIAESAFRDRFGGIDVVAVDVKPDPDPLDGDPTVWVNIVYDGDVEQLTGDGMTDVQMEVMSRLQSGPAEDLRFPVVEFIARSDIGRRDPATV